jgi:beta-glucosidase
VKHKHLIEQMTLTEKCGLLSGRDIWSTKSVERLGIAPIFLADGPTGLRKQVGDGDHLGLNASEPATCWPTAAAVACSWDPDMCEKIGNWLGQEAVSQGVSVVLGPGLNIKRSALCGRNFEYYSEDPYLSGKLAAGYIRGIQSQGVSACPKHFAANNQELNRMTSNSVVDERTLREIYLTNFEIAVKEGKPKFIMSSYNRINGVYANENEYLLQDILFKEWGFSGAVVSDWGGSNDHVEGVKAGGHLEMPGTGGDSDLQLEQAVMEGRISEELLDRRVDELLEVIFSLKHSAHDIDKPFNAEFHHKMAEEAAEQTVVLLKNESRILPLKPKTRVAVIGDFAAIPRYQGAGSSTVNPTRLENTIDVIGSFDLENVGFAPGYKRNGQSDADMANQALTLAKQAQVVLVYMGLPEIFEVEGLDRENMRLPDNQVELLHILNTANTNIVVILAAGSPVEMPWINNCKALVHGHLGGQAGASAILKVITGQINPSGKLAETYPVNYVDTPVSSYYPGLQRSAEYREGPYIGYRYFETACVPVRFPFGFGLSYTTFEYRDLIITESQVSFTIKNTGKMAGAEIAQVYIGCINGKVFRPAKELKGFAKVFLEPGETKAVSVALDDKAFRYYNVRTNQWETETAEYKIMVGSNAHDILLSGTISIKGTDAPCPYVSKDMPCYYSANVCNVSQAEFEILLGYAAPEANRDTGSPIDINDALCQLYYAKSGLARLVNRILTHLKNKSIAKGKPDLNILFLHQMPLRGIAKMTGGIVTMDMARALVVMVNGHFFKGIGQLIRGFFTARKAGKKARVGKK